jgi:hypothetical protein
MTPRAVDAKGLSAANSLENALPRKNQVIEKARCVQKSPAEPASSAGKSAVGRPVKPGRLLCLLSWRSKKAGRLRGRDPGQG